MIRPLRRRHLWMVAAVTVIIAPLYLASLTARPAPPIQESLPAELAVAPPTAERTDGAGVELPTDPPIRLRPVGEAVVEATADGFVEGADLLLYWAPAQGSRSIAEAHLLGALRGGERQLFELPAAASGAPGVIILYSLGHGEEIAYTPWPVTGEARS